MKEISYMMEFFVYKSSPAFIDRICQTFFLPLTCRNAKIITSFIYLLICTGVSAENLKLM